MTRKRSQEVLTGPGVGEVVGPGVGEGVGEVVGPGVGLGVGLLVCNTQEIRSNTSDEP